MPKTVLLAGGTSGIGLATVHALAGDDCQVVCACRSPAKVPELPGVTTLPFDATDAENLPDLPPEIDGLVYFPGTITLKPFPRLEDEDFLSDLEINLLGAVRLLRHALPGLRRAPRASVVFFSTVAVQTGLSFHASIAAAKGAVEGLMRSLAAELAPKIRVNCIAPSLTATPLAERLINTEDKAEASAERHPLKRIGDPAEVAEAVRYLLDAQSGFMTGQVFRLDGGLSSVRPL